jgi:hypothetical protein
LGAGDLSGPGALYRKGIKVSKAEMKCLDIIGDQFHPEWNNTITMASAVNCGSAASQYSIVTTCGSSLDGMRTLIL